MKAATSSLLILACLMAVALCNQDAPIVQDNSDYKWLKDIWRINIDLIVILICAPYFWILTFFANKPEKFLTFVDNFMIKKAFRLSYKYV